MARVSPAASTLRTVGVTRYVEPLREGGSLPGLVEGDDDGLYVAKFRGAGQGPGALVAEVVVGELGRGLGIPVPELVLLELPGELAGAEPDPEIQELLAASAGVNLGVDFLPGALPFTPAALDEIDPALAADIVWLDALTTNVDRTPRNPNLLVWHGRTWAIDHGAALYRQYGERRFSDTAKEPFPQIADHVLLGRAGSIVEADERLGQRAQEAVRVAVELVPDAWLGEDPDGRREELERFLLLRLAPRRLFAGEAELSRTTAMERP
jgi:hypothetical protein